MDVVLGYCDESTVLSVLYTCKDYHHVAIPHLYREVTLKTANQLKSFIDLSELARESTRIAARFFHTQTFKYEILDSWKDEALPEDERRPLYFDLREVCYQLPDGEPMFPNLKTASFPQVLELETDGLGEHGQTFLSNVETVFYVHSPEAFPKVHPPELRALGISRLRVLHFYHICGAELDSSTGRVPQYVGPQDKLEAIHTHLEEHFDTYLKRDPQHCKHLPSSDDTGALPSTEEITSARKHETVVYIRQYASGMLMHAVSAAFPVEPPSQYPNLKHTTLDLGWNKHLSDEEIWKSALLEPENDDPGLDPHSTDRHILLRRIRFMTLWVRQESNGTIVPGVLTDLQRSHVPDIIVRLGEKGPAWILAGHASTPGNVSWNNKPFVESEWRKYQPEEGL